MKIFGILNITPDSFSDGGDYSLSKVAVARAAEIISQGAFAIDIGAESTRPGAQIISVEEEINRLEPVLKVLSSSSGAAWGSRATSTVGACKPGSPLREDDILVSIDTRNSETAWMASKYANVKFLNDVSGFTSPEMIDNAKSHHLTCIVMHSLTVPADKDITISGDPVEHVKTWIVQKSRQLTDRGIVPENIIFDPGIGFGKTPEQSQQLIDNAADLASTCHRLGSSILYGHSRKSFLGGDITTRDQETAKISAYLQSAGVDYIRVHNISLNKRHCEESKLTKQSSS